MSDTDAPDSRNGRKGRIFAGTSGYSYREWKGVFFPEDLPPTDYLEFYATRFTTVEINNTFYRFPSAKVIEQWTGQTPEGFAVAVKANRRITHGSRLKDIEGVTTDFVERCRLLGPRLGPLLFQFPPVLRRHDARLEAFLGVLPEDGRYALEFRHRSWFEEEVFTLLRRRGVALVQSDGQKLTSPRAVTADFCYVRLRRDEYTDEELEAWRGWTESQRAAGRDVFVYLKHDKKGTSPEPLIRKLVGAGVD